MKKLKINSQAYHYFTGCPLTELIHEILRSRDLLSRMPTQSARYPHLYSFSKQRIELLLTLLMFRCDQITLQQFQQRVTVTVIKKRH